MLENKKIVGEPRLKSAILLNFDDIVVFKNERHESRRLTTCMVPKKVSFPICAPNPGSSFFHCSGAVPTTVIHDEITILPLIDNNGRLILLIDRTHSRKDSENSLAGNLPSHL